MMMATVNQRTGWSHSEPAAVQTIRAALALADFDAHTARQQMGMAGRTAIRPRGLDGNPRIGAVLMLLYPAADGLHVVYTKRPESMRDHSGQVAFPGGKVQADETPQAAALRETYEEIGVPADAVTVLGVLHELFIPPTDFIVHPFVGWAAARPAFDPDPGEVEALIEVPLTTLLDPATRRVEPWTFERFGGATLEVPFYAVNGYKIWGATAIMTSEFLARWRRVTGAV